MLVQRISVNQNYPKSKKNPVNNFTSFGAQPLGLNPALNGLVDTPFIDPFAMNLANILKPRQFRAFIKEVRALTPEFLAIRTYDESVLRFSISPIEKETKGVGKKAYTSHFVMVSSFHVDRDHPWRDFKLELNGKVFKKNLSSGRSIAKKLLEICQVSAVRLTT